MKEGGVSVEEAIGILRQAASGLEAIENDNLVGNQNPGLPGSDPRNTVFRPKTIL